MNPTSVFSEAQLDRLEELLDSAMFKDEAMQLDELQALEAQAGAAKAP